MKFGPVRLEEALGKVLGHNIAGPDGKRLLRKGRPLSAEDLEALRGLGRALVYVAEPGPEDIGENEAAVRVGKAAAGPGIEATPPSSGRVNLLARERGVFRVDEERLTDLNLSEGLTLATLPPHTFASARQIVATVKVIPYALPEETVRRIEAEAANRPLLRVDPLWPRRVGLILSGSASVRDRVRRDFEPPLRSRIEALGSEIAWVDFVPLEDEAGEEALSEAVRQQARAGAELIVLAGETAIVDRTDIAPRAIQRARGEVVCFGAPVDPGNLLLVAYLGAVPVLGAPGCARSRKVNVVDWVLPRLIAGERLTRADIAEMGAGGLLEDVPERPMPRGAR